MIKSSGSFARLTAELKKLPGVGEKTAFRLALHLLKHPPLSQGLAAALVEAKDRIGFCSTCYSLTEDDPCRFCTGDRDSATICVVEEPQDLFAVERSGVYRGRYHVLHGALSPINGVTPSRLRMAELMQRLEGNGVSEVLIATNFTVEGEATALYLTRQVKPLGIRVTRLAYGIPLGSDLEYVDSVTVQRALEGRNEL
jgi:recombination protein RecR